MDINLSAVEARIIGCLLEKESTTPDQYPLTLNALVNACNQKSSRDPVMSLSNAEVMTALNSLQDQRLISEDTGSRASRYKHRFCNTTFSTLQLSEKERAVICLMLLRGAQTPGELRSRSGRMATFDDVSVMESVLEEMAEKEQVVPLPKEPGRRDCRYAHLFSGEVDVSAMPVSAAVSDKARIRELEQEVADLKAEITRLKQP